MASASAGKDAVRAACDREKEVLAKQFEQRVAGLRLEKEQAKLDKALLRRLEKQGLLTAEWNTDESRPRKFYVTSSEGAALARTLAADWNQLTTAFTALTEKP